MSEFTTDELKRMLEKTAQESGLKIKGEVAVLKSDEQREAEKEIKEWKEQKTDFVFVKEFEVARDLIHCLFTTKEYSGMLMEGEGGLGKTILTINSVKEKYSTEDWEISSGYTTPLALYEFLYLNRNKKVIILDDVEGIFNNHLALSILKGALWETDGKRICQYSSKSDKAKMPEKFILNAKLIILCNHIPKENDVSTRATLSRVLNYKMSLSFEDKIKISNRFVIEENLKREQLAIVLNIINTKVTEATKDFNFRTLRKLIAFVKYDSEKAEKLFDETTEKDEDKEAYLEAVKKHSKVNHQIDLFKELCGKSRRQFFVIKKQLKISAKVQKNSNVALAQN